MANGTVMPSPVFTGWDNNGDPLSGGLLYTYEAGTTTPLATYSEVTLTTPNANPVVLDSAGRAVVYLSATSYKFLLKNAAGSTIWTQDNVSAVPTTSADVDVEAIAGEAIAAGEAVYLSDGSGARTAGRWYLTDADLTYASSAAVSVGIAPNAIASGATGTVRVAGRVTGLSALSAGSVYYVSATAGALTASILTNTRVVGMADTTTSLILTPSAVATVASGIGWGVAASVAGNALTVALTTKSGATPSASAPVALDFRNATVATGDVTTISVTAAETVVVPDTATLGTSNNVPFNAWIVAFNDAGTVRLGIINCASATGIYPLAAWGIASSTTIGTGADSAQVFYSDAGVTAKAYVVLGYVSYQAGLATAGTYASAPTWAQVYTADVPLPGRTVQAQYGSTSTSTSSSSSTYADSTLTATITPTSAANRVKVDVHQAGCGKDTGNSGINLKLVRASTDIAILGIQVGNTNANDRNYVGAISASVLDAPGSASAVAYKTQLASAANIADVTVQISSAVSTMVLTEVMA